MRKNITFIGAGNMAEALIKGLLDNNISQAGDITATDANAERLSYISDIYGIATNSNNVLAIHNADVLVLAVKPQVLDSVLDELKNSANNQQLIISIIAGAQISKIDPHGHLKVVRVMSNTPALVGEAATALCVNPNVTEDEKKYALAIFGALGKVVEVAESEINAVTGLSGSGPAFVFRLIESFIAGGKEIGLQEDIAKALAIQTFVGAARLAEKSDKSLQELVDQVTSPKGTTAAGREVLESSDINKIIVDTIVAAKNRADELSTGG